MKWSNMATEPETPTTPDTPPRPPKRRSFWRSWRGTLLFLAGVVVAWRLGFIPSFGGETTFTPAEQVAAMDFKRPQVNGQGDFQLSRLRGQVVLVNVWATWCPPCRMEIPDLSALHRKYAGKGFSVVGVAVDREGPDVVRPFASEHAIPYPVVMGDAELIAGYGGIRAVPTSFLIDKQGRLVKKYVGLLTGPRLERDIVGLL
jgi:cytochrome c biogenesis protein CcmG/thiol:disulfide interchange protein DsbE